MTGSEMLTLLPLMILSAGSVIILLVIAFVRNLAATAIITLVTQALAFGSIFIAYSKGSGAVTELLNFDSYAFFFIGLLIAGSFFATLIAYGYMRTHKGEKEEYFILLLLATLGSVVLASSNHFVSFFLGLEVLSISLYAMIAFFYNNRSSVEAGVKYLVLAASSAAIMLFGMALIYAETGTMSFEGIARALDSASVNFFIIDAGLVLLLVGIGYKLALVPFHMWTPDIYQGAPAPVTAFISTISKGSVFALLVHLFYTLDITSRLSLFVVFSVIGIASMLAGNLLALRQQNLKRILAYSSIAHLGYIVVAFLATGPERLIASTFYLVAYFVSILSAFGIITLLSSSTEDDGNLEAYRGLMWRNPWLSGLLSAALLSLAGIPLSVGFLGELYLVVAGVESSLWFLVIILVISSAIGLYYYLRVIVMMFASPPEGAKAYALVPSLSLAGGISLSVLGVLIIWLGTYPTPLLRLIEAMAATIH
jgi:NADH-quinone oxidoreductase subunit N